MFRKENEKIRSLKIMSTQNWIDLFIIYIITFHEFSGL